MSWESGDITMLMELTEAQENPDDDTVTISSIPLEETIHPHPLNFEPPLIEVATGESNGFRRHWEKLTYAFNLPDPADFPQLLLEADDLGMLRRYVQQCEHLAGYSVINDEAGFFLNSNGPGTWRATADLPSREAFGGTAVAFRQIHNHGEEASFDKVKGRLYRATGKLDQAEQGRLRAILAQWVDARGRLMNHTLPTIVCQKLSHTGPEFPVSFRDINPEDLLLTFNYGDTIHWGEHREHLVALTDDPNYEAFYKYALVVFHPRAEPPLLRLGPPREERAWRSLRSVVLLLIRVRLSALLK